MSRKYFGTDGVRGRVGELPITPEFVMRLGYAAGHILVAGEGRMSSERSTVMIGKDTRISGYMLESALEAGLSAAGVDVLLLGPMPTPAVAYLTRALRCQAGIVISASHNPYPDNGIKFFGPGGLKLADKVERAIEAALDEPMLCMPSEKLGKARRFEDADGRYIEFCKSTFPNELDLRGMRIVLDCGHGATYHIAPSVFHELGAEVIAIGVKPDGLNINLDCGSTHPETLQRAVRENQADLGIAFDGDGDRLMMVDADGKLYDGDLLLYIIACHRAKQGLLLKGGVVGTVMTNLGLEHAFDKHKIPFVRAAVGDRYVLEAMESRGWLLGGESSGHIICRDKHSTGDGIISALQVLHALCASKRTLKDAIKDVMVYPQALINVPITKDFDFRDSIPVQALLVDANTELKGNGRVLIRNSGTEPVLRVMVEGKDSTLVRQWAEKIVTCVKIAAAKAA